MSRKRKTIDLTETQVVRLEHKSQQENGSEAQIVRRALDASFAGDDPTSTPHPQPQISKAHSSPLSRDGAFWTVDCKEKYMATSASTVVGVFKSRAQAERAVEALQQSGFSDEQIMFAGHGPASTGSILDQLKSLFAGQDTPTGSVVNDLMSMGVPAEDADYYQHEYETGHSIVIVTTNGPRQEPIDILASCGGYGANKPSA